MKIGLIGAMDLETEMLLKYMEEYIIEEKLMMKFYIGKLMGVDTVLTTSSVGKVNASICAQYLVDIHGVDTIIMTGIAGSLKDELKMRTTVISNRVTYHDVRKIQMVNSIPRREYFETDRYLQLTAKTISEEMKINYAIGNYVTGDMFINSFEEAEKIKSEFSADCVDMEAAAVAHVAYLNEIPFLIIKSISDAANDHTDEEIELHKYESADISAHLVLNIIEKIGVEKQI